MASVPSAEDLARWCGGHRDCRLSSVSPALRSMWSTSVARAVQRVSCSTQRQRRPSRASAARRRVGQSGGSRSRRVLPAQCPGMSAPGSGDAGVVAVGVAGGDRPGREGDEAEGDGCPRDGRPHRSGSVWSGAAVVSGGHCWFTRSAGATRRAGVHRYREVAPGRWHPGSEPWGCAGGGALTGGLRRGVGRKGWGSFPRHPFDEGVARAGRGDGHTWRRSVACGGPPLEAPTSGLSGPGLCPGSWALVQAPGCGDDAAPPVRAGLA